MDTRSTLEASVVGVTVIHVLCFLHQLTSFNMFIILTASIWIVFGSCIYIELMWERMDSNVFMTYFRPQSRSAIWTVLFFPLSLLTHLPPVSAALTGQLLLQAGLLVLNPLLLAWLIPRINSKDDLQSLWLNQGLIASLIEAPLIFFLGLYSGLGVQLSVSLSLMSVLLLYVLVHLIVTLPKTFTYGELTLVAQLMVYFIHQSVNLIFKTPTVSHVLPNKDELIASVVLCIAAALVVLHHSKSLPTPTKFYGTYAVIACIFIAFWLIRLYPFRVMSLIDNISVNRYKVCLLVNWAVWANFALSVVIYYNSYDSEIHHSVRKYFHLVMIGVYLPGLVLEPQLLTLAAWGAFCILLGLEQIRMYKIPPFGALLNSSLSLFLDEKDSGPMLVTHIYLLVGFSVPVWMSATLQLPHGNYVSAFAGLLTLGIGDTMASIVGIRFGKTKLPGTKKSVEGTLASIVGQIIFIGCLRFLVTFPINLRLMLAIAVGSTYEASTDQIDNLTLPMLTYPLLNLL